MTDRPLLWYIRVYGGMECVSALSLLHGLDFHNVLQGRTDLFCHWSAVDGYPPLMAATKIYGAVSKNRKSLGPFSCVSGIQLHQLLLAEPK